MKYRPLTFSAITAFAAVLCATATSSAQSILKTAGNYTLLGGTAISVASPGPDTFSNGNVGLSPAATTNITGIPPYGSVTGNTLSAGAAAVIATGGATAQAVADLSAAHTGLSGMATNTLFAHGVDLGTVGPLPPGVYTYNTAGATETQTGALVLDAQHRNNVFWVFQFAASFTTAANSTVTVINAGTNGGNDDGIFFNAGTGAITIGDNNTTLGNYIAGTSISFTGITTFHGQGGTRALALAAVSFAGPGQLNALGGPGGSDWTGGLTFSGSNVVATALLPVITSPVSAAATANVPFSYQITATNPAIISYAATGLPASLTLNTVSGLISGTPLVAATVNASVTATNSAGTGSAVLVVITVAPAGVAPIITSPGTAAGTAGTPIVAYPIVATGLPTSYTATGLPPGLSLNPLTGVISGTPTASGNYVVAITATNSTGSTTATVTITIAVPIGARIVNFSARAVSGPGNQSMIVGFVVSGNGKNLLVRGIGPGLAAYGITSPLGDPMLTLYRGANAVATNSAWQTSSSGQAQGPIISTTDTQVGAFPMASGSADTALLALVNQGAYTTNLLSPNGTSGVALTEIYDTDGNPASARLVNVSARMNVTAGQGTLIAGLVIAGNISQTVLVRGIGPTLASYGVAGVLPDPQIAVFSGNTLIASNANWGTGTSTVAQLNAAFTQVGAFPLASGSMDCALIITLQPGAYTVQLTSASGATGVALVEVYDTQ